MAKTLKITLTDETAFYMDFLIADENLRYPRILFERLISQAIKKRKIEDRPIYQPEPPVDIVIMGGPPRGVEDSVHMPPTNPAMKEES